MECDKTEPIIAKKTVSGRARSFASWLACAAVFCSHIGCVNPQYARLPSWYTWFPAAENQAYERQDPFPDPDIGPNTYSTPRGYERPRSEPRRAAEQRVLQGVPVGPEFVPPGVPRGGYNYDKVVR